MTNKTKSEKRAASILQKKREQLIGKVFETNRCGLCTVVGYDGHDKVTVRFHEPEHFVTCRMGDINRKEVSNPMYPSFFGKGFMGVGKYSHRDRDLYATWTRLLQRVFYGETSVKYKAYKDVTVCDEWLNFQNFAEWCEKEDGYLRKDKHGRTYHLDKDLISKGSKIYSPDTCCFVPLEINNLFICSDRKSKYATGVHYSKDKCKFVAYCKKDGKRVHLGYFDTVEQAYKAYSGFKEDYIKTMAEKWKDSISKKAYEALLSWEAVDIESEVIKNDE
mgnify:FL=1